MDAPQLTWLDRALGASTAVWKVPVFHHPIYSSGLRHGSNLRLRGLLEPIFLRHRVKVAFSGHDHIYQRVTPQNGVQYFVSGAGGKLRKGDIGFDGLVAKGFDTGNHFMVLEAGATRFSYRALDVKGATIDEGSIEAAAPAVSRPRRSRVA
jgi:hypothetical protein